MASTLVLSGGGAKGDFEVGVLQYLYENGYVANAICSTSVGSVNAINGLKTAQSVFNLNPIRAKLNANLNPGAVAHSGVELRLVAVSLETGKVRYITQDGRVLETDGKPVPGANPTACAVERAAHNAAVQGYIAAGSTMQAARTVEDRREAMADIRRAAAQVSSTKAKLDQCMATAQESGVAGNLVVAVADGVIASASIPCVFPPVVLGADHYVDGGIRWVLPLKAALDFNSDTIIAINASPPGVPPAPIYYANANLLDIAERSVLDILLWEVQERHLEATKVEASQQGKRVWVVTPRVDVHDTLTIDPGLIDINMGYGYMRGADVLSLLPLGIHTSPIGRPTVPTVGHIGSTPGAWVDEAADQQLASLADAITICRRRCWEIEHTVFGTVIGELPFSPRSTARQIPDPAMLAGRLTESYRETRPGGQINGSAINGNHLMFPAWVTRLGKHSIVQPAFDPPLHGRPRCW